MLPTAPKETLILSFLFASTFESRRHADEERDSAGLLKLFRVETTLENTAGSRGSTIHAMRTHTDAWGWTCERRTSNARTNSQKKTKGTRTKDGRDVAFVRPSSDSSTSFVAHHVVRARRTKRARTQKRTSSRDLRILLLLVRSPCKTKTWRRTPCCAFLFHALRDPKVQARDGGSRFDADRDQKGKDEGPGRREQKGNCEQHHLRCTEKIR